MFPCSISLLAELQLLVETGWLISLFPCRLLTAGCSEFHCISWFISWFFILFPIFKALYHRESLLCLSLISYSSLLCKSISLTFLSSTFKFPCDCTDPANVIPDNIPTRKSGTLIPPAMSLVSFNKSYEEN